MTDESAAARAFFERHAQDFARSESHRTGRDLGMLRDALMPLDGMTAVDVATGAGFAALVLAEAGARVSAVDVAPAMLAQTARLAAEHGIVVTLFEADAAALPFADASVDRVASRRAAHHFPDVAAALREWHRVLRCGGLVAVADLSPPPQAAAFQDGFERIRDGSHRRALTPGGWVAALEAAGFADVRCEPWCERVAFDRWLYPVDEAGVREAVLQRFAAAPREAAAALGLVCDGDGWSFVRQRVVVSGKRP